MGLIVTQAGAYTARQATALHRPCRAASEWGAEVYREVVRRGAVNLITFLSFDWFADSKPVWHVAVAIEIEPMLLKPVALWGHNDQAAAVHEAIAILGRAGDISKGRWARKTDDGFDLYRAATPLEAAMAKAAIDGMAPLADFIDPEWLKEFEVNDGRAIHGSGEEAARADGSDAARISRRRVTAERVDDP